MDPCASMDFNKRAADMTYRTFLVNFGYSKYEGASLAEAKAEALRAGFESVIYQGSHPILSYSPISGWRGF